MDLGNLPQWDLSDLYGGPEAAELAADLDRVDAAADRFNADFCGKVGDLSAAELAAAITRAPMATTSCVADRPTGPWPKIAIVSSPCRDNRRSAP